MGVVLAFTQTHTDWAGNTQPQCVLPIHQRGLWCTVEKVMLQKPTVAIYQNTMGKKSTNAGMGGHMMQMHTWRHVHSMAPGCFSGTPKHLCGPGEGCALALQGCFYMNGCGLKGIRGPYVWHVLAAPP